MSEEIQKEEVIEPAPIVEEVDAQVEEPKEDVEDLKKMLENAKAENARKAQLIQQLKEEQDARSKVVSEPVFNPQDLTTWKDHELKAVMKDPQYVALHDQAQDLLDRRRFNRYQKEESEKLLRMNTELERQKNYPETFDPTHPLAVRMSELMHQHRLDNTPSGRLVAAKLAHAEVLQKKAVVAGRKAEQSRQADVNASFSGGASRPAPKASDKVKDEELKQRAQSGDDAARVEWFKRKGLI